MNETMKETSTVKGALAGVLASFVGLLAVVTWQLDTEHRTPM